MCHAETSHPIMGSEILLSSSPTSSPSMIFFLFPLLLLMLRLQVRNHHSNLNGIICKSSMRFLARRQCMYQVSPLLPCVVLQSPSPLPTSSQCQQGLSNLRATPQLPLPHPNVIYPWFARLYWTFHPWCVKPGF